MALRLIEAVVPRGERDAVDEMAEDHPVIDCWREEVEGDRVRMAFLVDAESAEPLVDDLAARFEATEGFRVILLPVHASVPRPEKEEPEGEEPGAGEEDDAEEDEPPARIAREELYTELSDQAELSAVYLALTALSAVVCSAGLLMGDVAVVIGAMVIAPILGPLVAVALATTLADWELGRRSLLVGLAGLTTAVAVSGLIGVWAPVSPDLPGIALRSSVELGHVGLALAAGSAGTLAFTTGTAAAVIGVMVAVALLPPAVAGGLLLGGGHAGAASGAFLLTAVNLISVNLAGVVTFVAQGVRPHRWWEAERARKATAVAVAVWTALLAGLLAVILWG
jgi:uncharacterized hydrophobic protein (TIGR00341 family)